MSNYNIQKDCISCSGCAEAYRSSSRLTGKTITLEVEFSDTNSSENESSSSESPLSIMRGHQDRVCPVLSTRQVTMSPVPVSTLLGGCGTRILRRNYYFKKAIQKRSIRWNFRMMGLWLLQGKSLCTTREHTIEISSCSLPSDIVVILINKVT